MAIKLIPGFMGVLLLLRFDPGGFSSSDTTGDIGLSSGEFVVLSFSGGTNYVDMKAPVVSFLIFATVSLLRVVSSTVALFISLKV